MPRHPRELSGPRELVGGATLALPLRGLSCGGSERREIEPPFHGAIRSPEPDPRGERDGRGEAADPRPGRAAGWRAAGTTGRRKPAPSARPGARERIVVAMLGLALAAVLAHAARRSTAIRNHISRRSR
jgi:hypothetical protein